MTEHPSFAGIDIPDGEPIIGRTYRADGWQYVALPWVTETVFHNLVSFLGSENIAILALSRRPDSDKLRGQVLISPDGQIKIREHRIKREQRLAKRGESDE